MIILLADILHLDHAKPTLEIPNLKQFPILTYKRYVKTCSHGNGMIKFT